MLQNLCVCARVCVCAPLSLTLSLSPSKINKHFLKIYLKRKEILRNPFALLVGMQISAATLGNSMEVPQKMKK